MRAILPALVIFGFSAYGLVTCPPNAGDIKKCGLRAQDLNYLESYFKCRGNDRSDRKCKAEADSMRVFLPFYGYLPETLKDEIAREGVNARSSRIESEINKFFNKYRKEIAESVGSDMHEKWRAGRRLSMEQAQKMLQDFDAEKARGEMANQKTAAHLRDAIERAKTTGAAIFNPREKYGMDIANHSFAELNAEAKAANLKAGEHMASLLERNARAGSPLSDNDMLHEIHNYWTSQNSEAAKKLRTRQEFEDFYRRVQAGEDIEGYTYEMKDGKRVRILEEKRYPPKSQLRSFDQLGAADQAEDAKLLHSGRQAIEARIERESGSLSLRARQMGQSVRARYARDSKLAEHEKRVESRLRPTLKGVALGWGIQAVLAGAELYALRQEQKQECSMLYPFIAVKTRWTNDAPGAVGGRCVADYDVESLKRQDSPVVKFFELNPAERQAVLNNDPGRFNGACDYFLKLHAQVSQCGPESSTRPTPPTTIR